jgi:phosphoadenosine phosphosulfate reductase
MTTEERAFYLLHSQLPEYRYALKSAGTIIEEGLSEMKQPYISMSFGKDSIVMAHLLLSLDTTLPLVYVDCGKWDEWPDTPRVKREFLNRFPCNLTEVAAPSIISAFRSGGFFVQEEEETPAMRKAHVSYNRAFGKALDQTAYQRGYDGAFIGLRAEESNNRRRLAAMRGSFYFVKTRRLWACYPLMYWTGKDVWAHIVQHELPYNELYDRDPVGRERARNGAMFGTRSARYGRILRIMKMYPNRFNQFIREFPEARAFL